MARESKRRGGLEVGRPRQQRKTVALICGLLLLLVAVVFGQTLRHDFINLDDNIYVYDNPHVTGGLTANAVPWAFTSRYASNWHPLTWISCLLDSQLYGLKAGDII